MEFKSIDEQVIQKYQEDEQVMIQLFVQWCVNHELDPNELYTTSLSEPTGKYFIAKSFKGNGQMLTILILIMKQCLMSCNFSAMTTCLCSF